MRAENAMVNFCLIVAYAVFFAGYAFFAMMMERHDYYSAIATLYSTAAITCAYWISALLLQRRIKKAWKAHKATMRWSA